MFVNQCAAFGGILFREQTGVGDFDEVHVAEILLSIGEREFDRLDTGVDIVGAVMAHRFQVIAFENPQREQLRRSLTRRSVLVDLKPAIINRDRLFDLSGIAGKVFVTKQAAVVFGKFSHLAGNVALVETIARSF